MIKNLLGPAMGLCIGVFMYSCQKTSTFSKDMAPVELAAQHKGLGPQAFETDDFIPGQLLVQFKKGTTAKTKGNVLAKIKGKYRNKMSTATIPGFEDEEVVDLIETNAGVLSAIEAVKSDPAIHFVEPNYIYRSTAVANDPYFLNAQWNMQANGFGCQASTAWANYKTGASDVYIGIIDQGYMYQHDDLAGNAGVNPGEILGNGVDDDKNGYIDDVYGWNFSGNNAELYNGSDYHGTHVAGIIGATGGNGIGVAGVVWNVKMLGGKFLNGRTGDAFAAVQAIDYFIALKVKQKLNIVALCCSWEGSNSSKNLEAAVKRAGKAGILIVAAAGNSAGNNDKIAVYPANYKGSNVISVASINQAGNLSYFSNYGAKSVDIAAPGEAITSTYLNNTYAALSGTSMAAPHVAGAAALYASTHPGAGMNEIKNAILSSAMPTPSLKGKCATGGRLDVSRF